MEKATNQQKVMTEDARRERGLELCDLILAQIAKQGDADEVLKEELKRTIKSNLKQLIETILRCSTKQLASRVKIAKQSIDRWLAPSGTVPQKSNILEIKELVDKRNWFWGTAKVDPQELGFYTFYDLHRKFNERDDLKRIWHFSTEEFLDDKSPRVQEATQALLSRKVMMCYVFPPFTHAETSFASLAYNASLDPSKEKWPYTVGFRITDLTMFWMFTEGHYVVIWEYGDEVKEYAGCVARPATQRRLELLGLDTEDDELPQSIWEHDELLTHKYWQKRCEQLVRRMNSSEDPTGFADVITPGLSFMRRR